MRECIFHPIPISMGGTLSSYRSMNLRNKRSIASRNSNKITRAIEVPFFRLFPHSIPHPTKKKKKILAVERTSMS